MNEPIIFTRCPLCGAVNIVHPGEPPHTGFDFRNRCQAHALTGMHGASGAFSQTHYATSWWNPKRSDSKSCGFPLASATGEILPFDYERFKAFCRDDFDPQALERLVRAELG
jgi:hypothetical protein